ncbi:uncharacterized protein LOC118409342 [Branchiostoma floridae]|uniref:Uncharacterized protein LOC118409342 n=1 Tax=Branchiostoma floridae TaxID=7739 RepID=A0A9J7HVQ2_BRAFL|nr:uncharacterized protein LOC118409342 [Branchiostoma floridae]
MARLRSGGGRGGCRRGRRPHDSAVPERLGQANKKDTPTKLIVKVPLELLQEDFRLTKTASLQCGRGASRGRGAGRGRGRGRGVGRGRGRGRGKGSRASRKPPCTVTTETLYDGPVTQQIPGYPIKEDGDHMNNSSHGQTRGRTRTKRNFSRQPIAQQEQTFSLVHPNGIPHAASRGAQRRGSGKAELQSDQTVIQNLELQTQKRDVSKDSRISQMAAFQTGVETHSEIDLKEDSNRPDLEIRRENASKRNRSREKCIPSKRRKRLNGSSLATPLCQEEGSVTTPEDGINQGCKEASSANGHRLLTQDHEPDLDLHVGSDDSDSDDDLPDINTSLQQDPPKPTFKAGEVVWVKSGRNPSWPAIVNHVYHKKKRMSVLFIGYRQKKGISVHVNAAKVFNSRMRDHFIEEALRTESKEFFQSIVTQVEDFLNKKACGKLEGLDAFQYFFPNETFPPDSSSGSDDDEGIMKTDHKDTEATQISPLSQSAGTSVAKPRDPSRHDRRMHLRKDLEKRIVKYIRTQQDAQDHLAGIYHGSVTSQRHQDFFSKDRAVREMLHGQGTGFITSDELAEELFSCLADLYHLRCEEDKNFADTKYVAFVLMPEAILYGLHKVKGISMEAAQKLMDKGPELFPAERTWYREALRAEPLTVEERRRIIHQAAHNVLGKEGSNELLHLT